MDLAALAQPGVLSDPTAFAEYLTFRVAADVGRDGVADAMGMISNVTKSIGHKDTAANLSVTVGFSRQGWTRLFPNQPVPIELHDFIELRDGPRHFPSTGGDIFMMIKCARIDLTFQAAKYLAAAFAGIATLTEDVQGFSYLDSRDMIDFVDGTENPDGDARTDAVMSPEEPFAGSSYLVVQKYVHRANDWEALRTADQEAAIGRTKADDIEIPDDEKSPMAHNVKSKVTIDGEEIKMLRQNRPFGNASEHGTMFVGFAKSPSVIETSLRQMITADEHGNYDRLLDFVDAVTGANYFVPPAAFVDSFA